jgi:hypothetical protein
MKLIYYILWLSVYGLIATAAPVPKEPRYTVDLSKARIFDDLLKTGIPLRPDNADANRVKFSYSLEDASILFRLPNGLEFEQFVELLVIYVEAGKIKHGHTNGTIMSVEEATGIIRSLENRLNAMTNGSVLVAGKMSEWLAEERKSPPGNSPNTYMNGFTAADGMLSLNHSIHASMNLKFRASISLDFAFEGDSVAAPDTKFQRISLDPKEFHSREEAWEGAKEEFLAAQAGLNNGTRKASMPLNSPSPSSPPARASTGQLSLWPWLAGGMMVLLLLLLAIIKRKCSRRV